MNKFALSGVIIGIFLNLARDLFAQQPPIHREEQKPPELPTSMSLCVDISAIPLPPITHETYQSFLNHNDKPYGLIEGVGDLLLLPADVAFDMAISGLHLIGDAEQGTITSRVMDIEIHSEVHLFPELMTHLVDREQRFLGGLSGTYLSSPQLEDGTTTINMHDFIYEEKKVLLDVAKKTYFAKYRFQAEERLREDAFYINEWRGVDYIALPPFLAGYLYYRGLDKSFDIDGFKIRTLIEPGQRMLIGNVIGAIMIDIRPKNFPIGIVGSMGLYGGHPEFEFIGIGTSINAVKQAIALMQ